MKRFVLALLCAAALPSTAALAQTAPPVTIAPGNTLLTVSADGRSVRTPDLAVFTAGVTSQAKTAGAALSANAADMNRVVSALKQAGIADRDIQTSNLSLNPVYAPPVQRPDGQYEQGEQKIVGYTVNNTVTVRQRKLSEFGRVIDTLVEAGANQVNGPSFQMDEPDAATDEARLAAMKKARARAELYARAAGLRVVRILSISESGGYTPGPPVVFARMAADSAAAPSPVAAGEIQLNATVTVLFELAP